MTPVTADSGRAAPRRWAGIWLLGLLLLTVPFLVPIPRNLNQHPVIGVLGDRLHIPLLFLITIVFWWRGPLRGRIWGAGAAAVVCGGAIEGLQALVGRSALWHDFYLDLIGIGLAVCWLHWHRRRSVWAAAGAFALIVLVLVQLAYLPALIQARNVVARSFPRLADFEDRHAPQLWRERDDASIAFPVYDDARGRVLAIRGAPPNSWPGAEMRYFPPDWSAYARLTFRARAVAPSAEGVGMSVRIDETRSLRSTVWYNERFEIGPAWREYSIDLADLRDPERVHGDRPLVLEDMGSIVFFFPRPKREVAMEIDDLKLEPMHP